MLFLWRTARADEQNCCAREEHKKQRSPAYPHLTIFWN